MKSVIYTGLAVSLLALSVAHAKDSSLPVPQVAGSIPFSGGSEVVAPTLTLAERQFATRETELIQQIRLLDLELEVAERQAKLVEASNPAVPAHSAVIAPVRFTSPPSEPSVRLLSTWGTPDALRAEVREGSQARTIRVGDSLSNGQVVESIRAGEVIVLDGNRTRVLRLEH